jgi:DNA-binding GntR family transcriptional regulator
MLLDAEPSAESRTHSSAERAYQYVKQRLLDGRFAGGTLLSENELARRLGVSRTPVREAFLHLEGEGLLQLYPRRGALVVPISPSEAEDLLEARMLIEPHCARRVAADPARAAAAAALSEDIAEQERALAAGTGGFIAADRRFHRTIVAANHNDLLIRQYDSLRDRHQRIAATTIARDPARIARFVAEHRDIAAAIVRGDPEAAGDLMAVHLRTAHELARRRSSA